MGMQAADPVEAQEAAFRRGRAVSESKVFLVGSANIITITVMAGAAEGEHYRMIDPARGFKPVNPR